MVTLQDISVQLMKPAKDLADWKFPLSQILEEYYALLEEPCSVNFGEAALVLQNSTNVYVRRIERLVSEIGILKQAFFDYEEGETKASTCKEKRTSKKAYVDFENFVIIDLEQDIGKNIDQKHRFEAQKKVKLLSHRFTQSNMGQLCIPIQMYDVLGEIIGNKYNFRCNQAVNTDGMLVDELTPCDFTCVLGSRVQKGRNSLSLYSEPKTPGTGTSGYHSATSPNDNESVTSNREEFEEEHNFSSQAERVALTNEPMIVEKESTISKDHDILFDDASTLQQLNTEKHFSKEHVENNLVQDSADIDDTNILLRNSKEISRTDKKHESESSVQKNEVKGECEKNDKVTETFEANDYKQQNLSISKEDQHQTEEILGMRKRGNRTTKTSICYVDDLNERDWKPMPFVQGIKRVLSNKSSTLKLPEYISLLEAKFGSKKRKRASKMRKPECLTSLVLREATSSRKEGDFITQAKEKFKSLRKQELEDFMKNFDECLNGTEKENGTSRCEAVTDATADLLGFRISQNQNNFVENNTEDVMSRSSSPIDVELPLTIRGNSPEISEEPPNLHNEEQEPPIADSDLIYSLPDYQALIEDKMKEICKESDVTTELDQTVAKWHASLKDKLSEAEVRPTFRIRDYASRIIESLQALDQKRSNFDHVVRDKPACEVARYFLASLQLANTYNVEISTGNSGNSIEIALLNEKVCERR